MLRVCCLICTYVCFPPSCLWFLCCSLPWWEMPPALEDWTPIPQRAVDLSCVTLGWSSFHSLYCRDLTMILSLVLSAASHLFSRSTGLGIPFAPCLLPFSPCLPLWHFHRPFPQGSPTSRALPIEELPYPCVSWLYQQFQPISILVNVFKLQAGSPILLRVYEACVEMVPQGSVRGNETDWGGCHFHLQRL